MFARFNWQKAFVLLCSYLYSVPCLAHDGPEPSLAWVFSKSFVNGSGVVAQRGPNLKSLGSPMLEKDESTTCVRLDGVRDHYVAQTNWEEVVAKLPTQMMTIAAWVSIDKTQAYGGIVGALQDNGNAESGWILGYNESTFTFGLASQGADDGNGKMTYLAGKTPIEPGRWYHVVAVYDGEKMQLWVNGKLENESAEQRGAILYPKQAQLALGAYLDDNEKYLHQGRINSVTIYDLAALPKWVEHDYEHYASRAQQAPVLAKTSAETFLVKPFLQYGTHTGMRVVCETTKAADVVVEFGETADFGMTVSSSSDDALLHSAHLKDLKPETGYYYQVVVTEKDGATQSRSELSSFQTASPPERPFAFTVIGDTQGNPKVNGKIAEMAWAMRPNFLILPGDLVDDGTQKNQWIQEFFASMHPLISRVPLYPVLGNHERNADHYYRYMDLPPPEYYYTFRYGNAAFFMIDSNKPLDANSEQYKWLEQQLEAIKDDSSVVWRFVSFHHPIYSSDENDYGDLWKGKSTWGDLDLRPLVPLFDKYAMDIVWNGHIHSYERTWPLKAGEATEKDGTVYMVTGGGGGGLEQAGPIRPWFQNNVLRGHHFVFVAVNGRTLELKSYDLEGRLFDTVTLRK